MEQTGWLPYPSVESHLSDVGQDINLAAQHYEELVDERRAYGNHVVTLRKENEPCVET